MNPNQPGVPPQPEEHEYKPKTIFDSPQVPSVPMQPQSGAVFGATPEAMQAQSANASKQANKKQIYIIGGIIGGVILLTLIAIISISLTSSNRKKTTNTDTTQTPSIIQPASDIELEQVNNSITQDMSAANDDTDYPADSLSKKNIGL
jgi:hypothetical protein